MQAHGTPGECHRSLEKLGAALTILPYVVACRAHWNVGKPWLQIALLLEAQQSSRFIVYEE